MSKDARKLPGAGNVIQMPDIYAEEYSVEVSLAEDMELEASADTDPDSTGFDPYDTARLYKK